MFKTLKILVLFCSFYTQSYTQVKIPQNIKHLYDLNIENKQFLILDNKNQVQLWNIEKSIFTTFIEVPQNMLFGKISPNGQYILSNAENKKEVLLFNENGSLKRKLKDKHKYNVICLAFSTNNKMIATGGQDQQLVLWGLDGQTVRNWEVGDMPVLSIAFSPQGDILATGDMENNLKLWDIRGNLQKTISHKEKIISLAFSKDGNFIVTGSAGKNIKVWTLNGKLLQTFPLAFEPYNLHITDKFIIILSKTGKGQSIFIANGSIQKYDNIEAMLKHILKIRKYKGELIDIEGGLGKIGSEKGFKNEQPSHEVILNGFKMSKYEVTNAQYATFLNEYESDKVKLGKFQGEKMIYPHKWGVIKMDNTWQASKGFEKYPVINVTWYGAYEYCKFYGGHLPTEAEWEYAAKSGNKETKFLYAGSDNIEEVAWYWRNSGTEILKGKQIAKKLIENKCQTKPIGQRKPNLLDLHDMAGNVSEWCSDWYFEGYYKVSPKRNPTGASRGFERLVRGGNWTSEESQCRSTQRMKLNPKSYKQTLGFRIIFY